VVVIEKNDEHARVVAARFTLFVVAVANLLRRRLAGFRVAVDLDEAELLDLLRLVVFENLEVRLLQVERRLPLESAT
jgi:hypothetical protein